MNTKPKTILIVDDNPNNLKLEKIILTLEGYDVHTATSGKETLEILTGLQPDLIMMDIQLSDVNGLELTKLLKANPKYAATPIVAVTAYAMKGDAEEALRAGCNGYITKPIDTNALPGQIAEYFNKKT